MDTSLASLQVSFQACVLRSLIRRMACLCLPPQIMSPLQIRQHSYAPFVLRYMGRVRSQATRIIRTYPVG